MELQLLWSNVVPESTLMCDQLASRVRVVDDSQLLMHHILSQYLKSDGVLATYVFAEFF